jgi:hypothetical protein
MKQARVATLIEDFNNLPAHLALTVHNPGLLILFGKPVQGWIHKLWSSIFTSHRLSEDLCFCYCFLS